MAKAQNKLPEETHPLLPSGPWEGFYTYAMGPDADKHQMKCTLAFKNNTVIGGGSDDIGSFTWSGSYDTEQMLCTLSKQYRTHSVSYKGQVDENGIWGNWTMQGNQGGFHIWPKANAQSGEAQLEAAEAKELEKEAPAVLPGKKEANEPI